ncbi:hypothetical protein [Streptomyces sp. NPDC002082]|uniref:hypothetical protein n=1 Tax=Streptomyces sp. NPDC002082 TaxID=3154772 RepID=UPI00332836BC
MEFPVQIIDTTLSAIAENGVEATLLGIGAAIVGPPVTKRLVSLTREFWGPRITRLRRMVAERVAPTEPTAPPETSKKGNEDVLRLHEGV